MTFDDDVRDTLLAHADDAPSGSGMLDAVAARERRTRARRRFGTAGAAAVMAVAVAVTVPYVLASGRHSAGRTPLGTGPAATAQKPSPTTSGSRTPTRTPSAVPSHASRVPLEPAAFAPIRFPLTPTFIPPGMPPPTAGRDAGGDTRLVYADNDSEPFMVANVGPRVALLYVTTGDPENTTINGHPAKIYTAGGIAIVWQLDNGKWVTVEAHGSFTKAQIKQYAVGLRETPMPALPLPINVAEAPRGFQVAYQEIDPTASGPDFYFSLGAPGHLSNEGDGWLGVQHSETSGNPMGGDPVQVGPDPGFLIHDGTGMTLQVLRPGFPFTVGEGNDGPLSASDLINFAIGITRS